MNADLAAIYGVTAPAREFERVEFPAESERAGLLGQVLFLALAAKHHHHGHLGISTENAPVVLPLDFGVHHDHVILQVGEGLFGRIHGQLVAFQVDNSTVGPSWSDVDPEGRWSVLVRGLATEVEVGSVGDGLPEPRIAEPGHRLVQVRSDVVTGRRIRTRMCLPRSSRPRITAASARTAWFTTRRPGISG